MRWTRLALILRHSVDRSGDRGAGVLRPDQVLAQDSRRTQGPMQITANARMTSRLIRVRSSNVWVLAPAG